MWPLKEVQLGSRQSPGPVGRGVEWLLGGQGCAVRGDKAAGVGPGPSRCLPSTMLLSLKP